EEIASGRVGWEWGNDSAHGWPGENRPRDEIELVGNRRGGERITVPSADGIQINPRGQARARARRLGRQRARAIEDGERKAGLDVEDSSYLPAAQEMFRPGVGAPTATVEEPIERDFPVDAANKPVSNIEIGRSVIEVRVERVERIRREAARESADVVGKEWDHVVKRLRPPIARRKLQPHGSPGTVGQINNER